MIQFAVPIPSSTSWNPKANPQRAMRLDPLGITRRAIIRPLLARLNGKSPYALLGMAAHNHYDDAGDGNRNH